ncbi:MAG: hypothetical protein ACJ8FO_04970 [Sphingomicrobium sp.]
MTARLRVTDHALVRYLERVHGLDVEAIRRHIADVCAHAAATGSTRFFAEGVRFEISEKTRTVVTVAPLNEGAPGDRVTLADVWPREATA